MAAARICRCCCRRIAATTLLRGCLCRRLRCAPCCCRGLLRTAGGSVPEEHSARPQAGLDAGNDAPHSVLISQARQLADQVRINGLARHQRQRLPRHRKHLREKEQVSKGKQVKRQACAAAAGC